MSYERTSGFDRSYFPDSWGEEDFECLAGFCRVEFGAEFVEALDDPDDYDYTLFIKTEADR